MKLLRRAVVPLLLVAHFASTPTYAWGILGHQLVMAVAIYLTDPNSDWGKFLRKQEKALRRGSVVPDWEWKAGFTPNPIKELDDKQKENALTEEHKHFFEPDSQVKGGNVTMANIGDVPIGDDFILLIPGIAEKMAANIEYINRIARANGKPQLDPNNITVQNVIDSGTLPWAVEQMHRLTIEALKKRDWKRAALYIGAMAHYLADSSMPFHSTRNYNPGGIHGVFEEKGLEAEAKRLGDTEDVEGKYWELEKTMAKVLAMLEKVPANLKNDKEASLARIYRMIASGYEYNQPLIDTWEAAKRKYPKPPPPPSAPGAPRHYEPKYTNEARDEFMRSEITVSGPDGQPQKISVLDAAHLRVLVGGQMLQLFLQSAYEQAVKEDPTLKNDLPNAETVIFDRRFAIMEYVPPNYLPHPGTSPKECTPQLLAKLNPPKASLPKR